MKKIGFIGIGLMGLPMAKNILKAGYQLKAFNRNASKSEPLKKFGGKISNSIKDVVSDNDVIITMLTDDSSVDDVMNNEEFLKNIKEKAQEVGGHGGMDFIMDYRLIYCLRNGLPLDQDVYDAAEWSSIVTLSRKSVDKGSKAIKIPDFTRGSWDEINKVTYFLKQD